MDLFALFPEMPLRHWLLFCLCAFLIGMSKAGVKGLGMLTVPLMAAIFGGKSSTGILLPMLSMADFFAVYYYNRHADWRFIWRLLPAAACGVLLGVWVGTLVNDEVFKSIMGILIIGGLILMIIQERRTLPETLTGSWWFGSVFGLLGGFSTMIGNAAGPVLAVYLLATKIPKNSFIGTGAWFFLIINLFKVPFHIFVWHTIDLKSFVLDLSGLPAIAIGVFLGVWLVKMIPEREFRYFIIGMTFLIALRLLWN